MAILKILKYLNWILHTEHVNTMSKWFASVLRMLILVLWPIHQLFGWLKSLYPLSVYRLLPKSCMALFKTNATMKENLCFSGPTPAQQRQAEWMFIIHVEWKDSGRTTCPYSSVLQSYVSVESNNHVQFYIWFYSLLHLSRPRTGFLWVGYTFLINDESATLP